MLRAGGIGGCTFTVDDAMVANKIWGSATKIRGPDEKLGSPMIIWGGGRQ